jgi:hypothetical protein
MKQLTFVDVEWSTGRTLDSSARGPGIDPTPNPDGIFWKLSSPFFQTTDIKTVH